MNTLGTTQHEPELRDIPVILERLKMARDWQLSAQHVADRASGYVSQIQDELSAAMRANGSTTVKGSGLTAQLKTRKGQTVTDETELVAALSEAGLLDDFTKLDKVAAAKYALANDLPGVEATATTYLSVSEVKA